VLLRLPLVNKRKRERHGLNRNSFVWLGELDIQPFRDNIEFTFTCDARPLVDLVDTTYLSIQSRYPSGGQHLSLGLFRYYCFTLWWLRVLWLHKSNTNVLTIDEKNTLNILSDEEFFVPSHIAQYLANMGNFTHGGDNFYFLKFNAPPGSFDADDMAVKEGWFEVGGDGPGHVTESEFWHYAQLPAPGVYTSFVCNEANNLFLNPAVAITLGLIAPEFNQF